MLLCRTISEVINKTLPAKSNLEQKISFYNAANLSKNEEYNVHLLSRAELSEKIADGVASSTRYYCLDKGYKIRQHNETYIVYHIVNLINLKFKF